MELIGELGAIPQYVRFPRSARPTTPTHGNKLMLPIRADTTKRQRWWPSVTGFFAGKS